MDENNQKINKPNSRRVAKIFTLLFILLVIALGAAGYFFWQWNTLKNNPDAVAQNENRELVATIGKIILLPEGEEPTVATVTDPAALADQPFFENAEIGFKVLVYSMAKKAILYDPFSNRIIEIGPVTIPPEAAASGSDQNNTGANSNQ